MLSGPLSSLGSALLNVGFILQLFEVMVLAL